MDLSMVGGVGGNPGVILYMAHNVGWDHDLHKS